MECFRLLEAVESQGVVTIWCLLKSQSSLAVDPIKVGPVDVGSDSQLVDREDWRRPTLRREDDQILD